jgi:hypothetical protein
MPRDGLSQYAPPPGTNGITNYTIESTKYNGFVADVTQDLNLPRPIVAGGTGANNAHDAMIALSGEIAKQVVTNYDSFAWVNGSFYSAAGATSAPNPTNRFAGIYYANADDSYATVEARDQTTGISYVRNKVAGVWGAWAQGAGSVADLDAAYVNVAGDTMTGALAVNAAVTSVATATTGSYYFGNSGTKSLSYDGTNFNLVGGPLYVSSLHMQYGTCYIANGSNSGFINLGDGSAGTGYIAYNGTKFNLGPGPVTVDNTTASTSPTTGALTVAGGVGINGNLKLPAAPHSLDIGTQRGANAALGVQFDPTAYSGIEINSSSAGTAGGILSIFNNAATPWGWSWAASQAAINVTGPWKYTDTTASSAYTNGALTVAGGVGIGGTTYIGGLLNVQGGAFPLPGSTGAVRIGYAGYTTQYGIVMRPQTDGGPALLFGNSADVTVGQIATTTTATNYITSSDERLKEDLKSFDAGNIVDNTNVYDFKWRSTGERAYGVVAQEANEVYPTAVVNSKIKKTIRAEGKADEEVVEDFWGVDYSKYVPVLLQELKALRERVRDLEGKVGVGAQPA